MRGVKGVINLGATEKDLCIQYAYVLVNTDDEVELQVDKEDFIQNADGDVDIPLELVLRKNQLSLSDLNRMNIQKCLFIRRTNGKPCTLKQISLNVNL